MDHNQFKTLLQKKGRDLSRNNPTFWREQADSLIQTLHDKQLRAWNDPVDRKAVLCPRRAGKSYFAMITAFAVCLSKPRANVVIICLTRGSGKDIYWSDMRNLAHDYEVAGKFNLVDLEFRFANESRIKIFGADSYADIDKLRGQRFDYVVIDECKSYSARVLDELIAEVLEPALADEAGTLVMIGTPGNILKGPFYEATAKFEKVKSGKSYYSRPYVARDREPYKDEPHYWSFHSWTCKDNTAKPKIWVAHKKQKEIKGWDDDHPTWRREALGQWCPSGDLMVYKYNPDVCGWDKDGPGPFGLPTDYGWRYLIGVDLGWHDATAVTVAAYSPQHNIFYHLETTKAEKQDHEHLAARVKALKERYGDFDAWVMDSAGAGKMLMEGINRIHDFNFVAADKKEKQNYIELMNEDMRRGRVKILRNSDLSLEMNLLQWDSKYNDTEQRREDPKCPNHACDSFLYTWKFAYHHWFAAVEEQLEPGSPEWWKMMEDKEFEKVLAEEKRKQNLNWQDEMGLNTTMFGDEDEWMN